MDGRVCQWLHQSTKPSAHSHRSQLLRVRLPFPREPEIIDELASKKELRVGGDHEPGPAVGLFGHLQRRCRPSEGPLDEPERVLDVKPAQVGPPTQIEVGFTSPRPPQPQRLLDASRRFREVLDFDSDHASFDDGRFVTVAPAPPTVQPWMQTVQAVTITFP